MKQILEEYILNRKIEFTLKKILRIIKKEFYEVFINIIKKIMTNYERNFDF